MFSQILNVEQIQDHHFATLLMLKHYDLVTVDDDLCTVNFDENKKTLLSPLKELNFRASMAYLEAVRLGQLDKMMPLIALFQVEDLRFNNRFSMKGDVVPVFSDYLFQLKVLVHHFSEYENMTRAQLRQIAHNSNLNLFKFKDFLNVVEYLEDHHSGITADYRPYQANGLFYDREFDRYFKQVIFAAMLAETYPLRRNLKLGKWNLVIPPTKIESNLVYTTDICHTSTVVANRNYKTLMASGTIRSIVPQESRAFAVLDMVTLFHEEDVSYFIETFGQNKIDHVQDICNTPCELKVWLDKKASSLISDENNIVLFSQSFLNRRIDSVSKKVVGKRRIKRTGTTTLAEALGLALEEVQ